MNRSQVIKAAGVIGSFCVRHFLALVVTVAVACLFWTVTYIALFVWALITGDGIGGPFAYPAGLLFFVLAGTAACLLLLLPSTALAGWLVRRHGYPVFAQIPVSVATLGFLCLGLVGLVSAVGSEPTLKDASIGFSVLFLVHLLPLGLYWWTAQSGPLVLSLLQRLRLTFRS